MANFESYCFSSSYNRMVLRTTAVPFLAVVLVCGCGPNIKSKEKVEEAILKRLQTSAGLDLKSLDVNTNSVTFDNNMAYASVAFHQKDDPNLKSLVMTYTLENRSGQWVVVKVGSPQGHDMSGSPSGQTDLPPGHPPVDQGAVGQAK
jgi:hypothetical protein